MDAAGTKRYGAPVARGLRMAGEFPIRPMRVTDARRVAELSRQLGYPSTPVEVARRIRRCSDDGDPGLFVAEHRDGRVVGWIHVVERRLLQAEPAAEICGLVVDERVRRGGVGRALVAQAERRAAARGFSELVVRTDVERSEAPSFYRGVGYDLTRTSHKFRKRLPG
jgi:GNAT superfamily N-acetyltransferase